MINPGSCTTPPPHHGLCSHMGCAGLCCAWQLQQKGVAADGRGYVVLLCRGPGPSGSWQGAAASTSRNGRSTCTSTLPSWWVGAVQGAVQEEAGRQACDAETPTHRGFMSTPCHQQSGLWSNYVCVPQTGFGLIAMRQQPSFAMC